MLSPKRVKHRKVQKGRRKGLSYRGSTVAFGTWGLQATEAGFITSRQIEAARIAMTRKAKRGGKVWIRIFPDKPLTKKPAASQLSAISHMRSQAALCRGSPRVSVLKSLLPSAAPLVLSESA